MLWIEAEIAMKRPSFVSYTLRGAVLFERLPMRGSILLRQL